MGSLSTNSDVLDLDINDGLEAMSDSEVLSELSSLQQEADSNDMNATVIERPVGKNVTNQPTPKMSSAVVVLESFDRSFFAPSNPSKDGKKEKRAPRKTHNRNGSSKQRDRKSSEGSLVSMLSKIKVSSNANMTSTPEHNKRVRSGEPTPESNRKQPNKVAKTTISTNQQPVGNQSLPAANQTFSLVVRRTLNLKICLANRPPTGRDLPTIKSFLVSKIEEAIANRARYLPTFVSPCKIERDVFCSDFSCAEWISDAVKNGIPEVEGALTILPHDTPLTFKPEFISVRTVICIPTKKPKAQILDFLAQMNRDLNTEKWQIKNIRPKGSCNSIVYMRMDKRSFDQICEKGNLINWILGPVTVQLEEHRSKAKSKTTNTSAEAKKASATDNTKSVDNHPEPPSTGSVDGSFKAPRLTKYGGSGLKRENKPN